MLDFCFLNCLNFFFFGQEYSGDNAQILKKLEVMKVLETIYTNDPKLPISIRANILEYCKYSSRQMAQIYITLLTIFWFQKQNPVNESKIATNSFKFNFCIIFLLGIHALFRHWISCLWLYSRFVKMIHNKTFFLIIR